MDEHKDNLTPDEEALSGDNEKRTLKREKIEVDESLFENSTVFCATEENKKKKSKLSPIVKGIISVSSLAVVTAIVLVVVLFLLPEKKEEAPQKVISTVSEPEVNVMKIAPSRIKQVSVKNENDSFVLIPEVVTDSDGNKSYAWLAKGFEHIDFSTPAYMVDAVINVNALKTFDIAEINSTETTSEASASGDVTSTENGDLYGIEKPYAELNIELNDGDGYKVTVGGMSPDKSGRYMTIDGEGEFAQYKDKAYLISTSTIDCVGNSLLDCVNMISAPAFVSTGDEDEYFEEGELIKFDEILIGGRLHKDTIKVICPSDELSLLSYMIEEPSEQAANDESINNILTLTSGIFNGGAYCLDYTKSDLKKYGLDDPYLTYFIKAGNRYIDMKISEVDENGNYAYIVKYSIDGGKTVYDRKIIYKSNAAGYEFFEMKSNEIYFEKLFIEYVKYLESLTVTIGGEKSHTFTLDHEEGNEAHFTVTTEIGKEIDEDEFCYYYARLLYLSALENTDKATDVGSDYVIKFNLSYTTEGKSDDEIIIYPYDQNVRRYIYKLNGKGTALVSRLLVDDLIDCLEPLANGEKIGNKYAN